MTTVASPTPDPLKPLRPMLAPRLLWKLLLPTQEKLEALSLTLVALIYDWLLKAWDLEVHILQDFYHTDGHDQLWSEGSEIKLEV